MMWIKKSEVNATIELWLHSEWQHKGNFTIKSAMLCCETVLQRVLEHIYCAKPRYPCYMRLEHKENRTEKRENILLLRTPMKETYSPRIKV